MDHAITQEMATAAKDKLSRTTTWPCQTSVGLGKVGKDYAIKVNLSDAIDASLLPQSLDGVPIVYAVTGTIRPL